MELFKAGKSQLETIYKWIDDSDVYMLILGGRYGSIEDESRLSYTELEYRYALSKNMPVFAIVLDDSFLCSKAVTVGKDAIFEKDNLDKYDNFKSIIKTRIVKFADSMARISHIISTQLNNILTDKDYHLIGWTRTDSKETKSIDFKSLSTVLNQTIVYIDTAKGVELNANELLLDNMYFFNKGINSSFFPNATILLKNGILEHTLHPKSKEDILIISKLGSEYYNYLLLTKNLIPKKVTFRSSN